MMQKSGFLNASCQVFGNWVTYTPDIMYFILLCVWVVCVHVGACMRVCVYVYVCACVFVTL